MQRLLVVLFCLCALSAVANPVWENNLQVRSSVAVEWTQACVPVGDGSVLFVWSDAHCPDRNIYAQRISPQGNPMWPSPRAIDAKSGIQRDPTLAKTSDGNFVVAWVDKFVDPGGGICLQKINAAGERLWPEGGIGFSAGSGWDKELRLIPDNLGGVVVTWTKETDNIMRTWAQSFGPAGNLRWPEGGIMLTNQDYYLATSVIPDGENGIYVAYSSDYDSQSRLYLNRFAAEGTPAWNAPVCIGSGTEMHRMGLLSQGGNAVWLAWYFYDGYDNAIMLQRFNHQGSPLWAAPLEVSSSQVGYDLLEGTLWMEADNSLLLTLISTDNPGTLSLLKIGPDGQSLFGNGITVDDDVQNIYSGRYTRLQADGAGGCVVAWSRCDQSDWYGDLYVQRYSAAGAELWQSGGVLVCDDPGSPPQPVILGANNQVWTAWNGCVNTTGGIWYQILNGAGSQTLEPNGRMLYGGLPSMWTEGALTLARSGDFLTLWNDDRLAPDQSQVYLQAVNTDGSVDFVPNGVAASAPTGADQFIAGAKVLPNDQVVVVWNDRRTGMYNLYAQLLDPQGNRLWNETGVQLSDYGDGWDSYVQIGQEGLDILIGWSHLDYSDQNNQGDIRLQRISGGQPLWGMNGICPINDTEPSDNRLMGLEGDYLAYLRRPLSPGNVRNLYVLRFNPGDGTAAPAWGSLGKPVAQEDNQPAWYRRLCGFKQVPQGIMALFTGSSDTLGQCVLAQVIDPEANYLLSPTGELLVTDVYSQDYIQTLVGEDDITLYWIADLGDLHSPKLQRFSYALETVWGPVPAGVPADQGCYVHVNSLANHGLALVWPAPNSYDPEMGNASIFYRYVTPSGALIDGPDPDCFPTTHLTVYSLCTAALGNRTLVTWTDGSSFYGWKDEPIEHTNVWAQLLNYDSSALPGPGELPVPPTLLHANRPNPFSAATTVYFTLKEPGRTKLFIYNIRGQKVRTLLDSEAGAGEYSAVWDGCDEQGRKAAPGVYFCRLQTGKETFVRRMVLLR